MERYMSNQTGGPAFPTDNAHQSGPATYHYEGMTMRDYFAAKAMQTLIACVWERSGDSNYIIDNDGRVSLHLRAYEHADSMLAVRNHPEE
jgi:hypothetical protein